MSLLVSLVIDSCSGTEEFSPCLCIYISLQSPHEGNRHITSESNCLCLQKMFCELLVKLENYALSIRIIVLLSFSDTQRQAAMRYLQALGGKTHGLIMHTPKPIECKTAPASLFTRHPLILYIECPSISSFCLQRKIMQPSFLNTHPSSSLKTSAFDKYRQSFYLKSVKQCVFKSERGPITDSCGTPNVPLHPMVRTAVSEGLPAWKAVYVFLQWIEHPADLKFQSAVNSLTSEHKIRHII